MYSGAQNKRDGQQTFDGFCHFEPERLELGRKLVPHFKALIFSSLELQGQRPMPPNRGDRPLEAKLDRFQFKGHGGSVWRPSP